MMNRKQLVSAIIFSCTVGAVYMILFGLAMFSMRDYSLDQSIELALIAGPTFAVLMLIALFLLFLRNKGR